VTFLIGFAMQTDLKTDLVERTKNSRLGTTCEITSRFREFGRFRAENEVSARFALQSEARSILRQTHRIRNCLRTRISERDPVEVWRAQGVESLQTAHFANLQTCASVWVCPVCAAKISQRRLADLQAGIANWESAGNTVMMATFTLQHNICDTCIAVLQAITEAHKKFWGNRQGKKIAKGYQIAGKVRGLEVTFTEANGWHWHYHVLLFIRGLLPDNEQSSLNGDMSRNWGIEVARAGSFADSLHGFNLARTNGYVGEYFTKHGRLPKEKRWDEAHELALSPVKRAGQGGSTPFELLTWSLVGQGQAGLLFNDYARAVKGKSQIHWSRGLRAMVGLSADKSDQQLVEEQEKTAVLLARIERHQWAVIIGNAARGELLKIAALGDAVKLQEFLIDLGAG
jgi:hypothetical protein